ncbi:MAG: zinc ribbon domain-containing protein [bacterium]
MPLKEFECESCRHRFEVIVWLREPDPAACPKCGKSPLKQILGTFRIAGVRSKSKADDEGGDDLGGLEGAGQGDDFGGGGDEGGWGGAGDEDLGDAPDTGGEDAGGASEPAGEED